jgi:hypothetical protein
MQCSPCGSKIRISKHQREFLVREGISIINKGSDLDRSVWLADKRTRACLLL